MGALPGDVRTIDVQQGTLEYHDHGAGPVVLLVHGVLVNASLWSDVVPDLAAAGLRCVTPVLPLGGHRFPAANGADLSPPGIANLLRDLIEALGLEDPIIVGNDTGTAYAQLLMASSPEVLAGAVLTNGDAFERFFPPLFRYLQVLSRAPGLLAAVAAAAHLPYAHRTPLAFGRLSKRLSATQARAFVRPMLTDAAVRRDAGRVLRQVDARYTLEAARRLHAFDKPVLFAWAGEDRVFPIADAHRLADTLPDATVEDVPDSYTYVPIDNPQAFVRAVTTFVERVHTGSTTD